MKLWLPERIYKYLKDFDEYKEIANKFEKDMAFDNNTSIIEYSNRFSHSFDPTTDLYELLSPKENYKEELEIIMSSSEEYLKEKINTGLDVENRLMAMYYLLALKPYSNVFNDEYLYYSDLYVKTLNSWREFDDFSERIWIKYFEYVSFFSILELSKKGISVENKLLSFQYLTQDYYERCVAQVGEESSLEILNHKMYLLLYYFILYNLVAFPLTEYKREDILLILEYFGSINSKYSGYTLWELNIFDIILNYCIDYQDTYIINMLLEYIVDEINERITNNEENIKALGQHNYYLYTNYLEQFMYFKVLFDYFKIGSGMDKLSTIKEEHINLLYKNEYKFNNKDSFLRQINFISRNDSDIVQFVPLFSSAFDRAVSSINKSRLFR